MGMDLERVLWSIYACNLQHQWYFVIQLQQKKKKVFLLISTCWLDMCLNDMYRGMNDIIALFSEAHSSKRTVKYLTCLLSLSEMILRLKLRVRRVLEDVEARGSTGTRLMHKSVSSACGNLKRLSSHSSVSLNRSVWSLFCIFNHKINNPITKIPLKHLNSKSWSKFDYIVFFF